VDYNAGALSGLLDKNAAQCGTGQNVCFQSNVNIRMLKNIAPVLLFLFASTPALGQSMEQRVLELERRVEQLEKRSSPVSATPVRPQNAGGQDGWKLMANWRALKRGMRESDVRALLGEPHRVDAGAITHWQYGSGMVDFIRDQVSGWSEPQR
jgi:hypothetical protein